LVAFALLLSPLLLASRAYAEKIDLTIGLVRAGGQDYFVDLIEQSLKAQGHELTIKVIGNLPQKRIIHMMENNQLSLTWLIKNKERDAAFTPIDINITNGLIGHRFLLIPPAQGNDYNTVKSLEDFRKLNKTGAFGSGWFDVAVWTHNNLRYIEKDGDWQATIYGQIAAGNRGVDYFSRGFFEIVDEAENHPELLIEPRLMLVYERDFQYYLSRQAQQYQSLLKASIEAAKQSGLMDRLIKKHWAKAFETLRPTERTLIPLATPSM
jgi:hypothetical protein